MILLMTIIVAVALAVPVTRLLFRVTIEDPVQVGFDREFASIVASQDWD